MALQTISSEYPLKIAILTSLNLLLFGIIDKQKLWD